MFEKFLAIAGVGLATGFAIGVATFIWAYYSI